MIPFIDLTRQHAALRAELLAATARVLDSSQFVLGAEGRALEQELAAVCGVPWALGVASGTDALRLTLTALGVGPGHRWGVGRRAGGSLGRRRLSFVLSDQEPRGVRRRRHGGDQASGRGRAHREAPAPRRPRALRARRARLLQSARRAPGGVLARE